MSNKFPSHPDVPPQTWQLAKEIFDTLGCKEQLTREFIIAALVAVRVFDYKQGKYGPGNIAEFGEVGVMIRTTDKIKRLINLWRTEQEPADETKEDSWGDLANYGLIALMCRWGWWPGVKGLHEESNVVLADEKMLGSDPT